ncbi:MAG: IPT/TIG domain-containing protein [Alistipes sp.]
MKIFYGKCRLQLWLTCLVTSLWLLSCSDDQTGGGQAYQPDQPIELESFSPKGGPIATQVILKGKNFGTQIDEISVYFNEKQAAIISSTGDRMLVLAPKLPGEECVISVSIGDKKVQFDEVFDYVVQTTVSTLAGGIKGASMPEGTGSLSTAQFSQKPESSMAIDADNNLFVVFKDTPSGASNRVYLMSEEAGSIKSLADIGVFLNVVLLSYDYVSNNVYWFNANIGEQGFSCFSRVSDYVSLEMGRVAWDKPLGYTEGMSSWGARSSFAMNPTDHKFYFYTNEGTAARFDPVTAKGENLTNDELKAAAGDVMGIVFDPRDNNISYFAVRGQHCIYKHNIAEGTCEVWAGRKNTSGYLDGALDEAQFNAPCQMCADQEYIYVADRDNHCVRRITLATGYVSTIAGTAKSSGYANGPAEVSMFNGPTGLVIDSEGILYVGDSGNYAIRRIATE